MQLPMKAALILLAYIAGSIPIGVLLSKLTGGKDVRATGSGNIGATNVYRVNGKTLGILTLLGDAIKGALPTAIAINYDGGAVLISLVALAAITGHLFSVFLQFKGGKGVATAMGIFLLIAPIPLLVAVVIFTLLLKKFRYVSLASVSAAASIPILVGLLLTEDFKVYMFFSLCVSTLIIYKHKANIIRLLNDDEHKI